MMTWLPTAVYILCLLTSIACAALLLRRYASNRTRLLLGFALGFVALALNNLFLVADMIVFPHYNLWFWRQLTLGSGIAVMLWGFMGETR